MRGTLPTLIRNLVSEHRPPIYSLPVSPEQQEAAEQIRAHLVHLRGGAPFLSPADARCLVRWFDEEVPTQVILVALERCAESRRRSKARRPFSLRSAKRHLYKSPLRPVEIVAQDGHPFLAIAAEVEGELGADLAGSLRELPVGSEGVLQAVELCREQLEKSWNDLEPEERLQRISAAIEELGDLAAVVDEDTLQGLAEEVAREEFRRQFPRLDTATFSALADTMALDDR